MAIKFKFEGTDLIIQNLSRSKDRLMPAVVEKMTFLMTKLAERAQELAPVGETGQLRESIRAGETDTSSGKVTGRVEVGGEETTVSHSGGKAFDYAQSVILGRRGGYPSNPLGVIGTAKGAALRSHGKGPRRTGQNVLSWFEDGKQVWREYAFPGPAAANPFMNTALDEMRAEIEDGLAETIKGIGKK